MFTVNALRKHSTVGAYNVYTQVLRRSARLSSSLNHHSPPFDTKRAREAIHTAESAETWRVNNLPSIPSRDVSPVYWKQEFVSLGRQPSLDIEALTNVVKNIQFSHPREITELLRDWSHLLGQLQDKDAWVALFDQVSALGIDGLKAVWTGYVLCDDKRFAGSEYTALFLFKCSLSLYEQPEEIPWVIARYEENMVSTPYRDISSDTAPINNFKFLADLWCDMLGPPQPALLNTLWLSAARPSKLAAQLMTLNAHSSYSILASTKECPNDVRLRNIELCMEILDIASDAMPRKNQTNVICDILVHCRQCIGHQLKEDGTDDSEFTKRQAMFLPIVERADMLIRSYKLDLYSDELMASLLSSYSTCHRHDKVVTLWHELCKRKIRVISDSRHISALFYSCGIHGDKTLALLSWSRLRASKFPLNERVWAAYLQCLGRLGEWQRVLNLLINEMKNRAGDPPAPYPTQGNLANAINEWRKQSEGKISTRIPGLESSVSGVPVLPTIRKEFHKVWPSVQERIRLHATARTRQRLGMNSSDA